MTGRSAPCPLCSGSAALRLTRSEFHIHRCARCDFEFVYPTPSPEQIAGVYRERYFTGTGGHGYADYFRAERATNERKAGERLDHLLRLGAAAPLLDVGAADGTFVRAALDRGLDARGVEVSTEALAALAPALRDRMHASLDEAAPFGPFGVVTLWDVLEHLPDFVRVVRRIRALLAPGGLVGIVVPVIDNVNARLLPRTWDQYKPPEHLSFFSRQSLHALLTREIGAVVLEEPAWRRDARWLDVARPARSAVGRVARAVERRLWRASVAAGLVPRALVTDSIAMIARAEG